MSNSNQRKIKLLKTIFMESATGEAMQKVPVNKIIPLSTVDGPGARTAIFLQACNLACEYCHNPETQNNCIHCGLCVPGCPTGALTIVDKKVKWNSQICIHCDQCIKICPHFASPKIKLMDAREIMAEIQDNLPFIRGITTSGGECTLYPVFLTQLFTIARKLNLTTLMDANGAVDLSQYPALLDVTSGVMLDLKAWDGEVYLKLTGQPKTDSLVNNLKLLAGLNKLTEIRLVCAEGWVDVERALKGVTETIPEAYGDIPLKLITFRKYGVKGKMIHAESPDRSVMQGYADYAKALGFRNITVK